MDAVTSAGAVEAAVAVANVTSQFETIQQRKPPAAPGGLFYFPGRRGLCFAEIDLITNRRFPFGSIGGSAIAITCRISAQTLHGAFLTGHKELPVH